MHPQKILIASDHAGYELKAKLIPFLIEKGFNVVDEGAFENNPLDDYPDYCISVAREISENPRDLAGIVIGGSGQGEAITANRLKNVRATVYYGGKPDNLKIAREHNDANIISLGARFLSDDEAKEAVMLWLDTPFSEVERHKRRIEKLERLTARE